MPCMISRRGSRAFVNYVHKNHLAECYPLNSYKKFTIHSQLFLRINGQEGC